MIYDLVIVGLGPAGVSAAIYAKRAGLKVVCLEKAMIGGYLNYIDRRRRPTSVALITTLPPLQPPGW